MRLKIFVVDDEETYRTLLRYKIQQNAPEAEIQVFENGESVLNVIDENPDLVLLDIMMPGIDGIETLKRIKKFNPMLNVVMVSAGNTLESAVDAMKHGANDYLTKGTDDMVKLDRILQNLSEKIEMANELAALRGEVASKYGLNELIGDSPAMENVYRLIQKALRGDLTVAINGESGTGKELVARAIHFNSSRKRGPFVVVNCAAIPSELMESEFFGHEKGSFTGAHARKIGKFEQAHGGTIFLDEVSELDISLQAKLLRALQNREITRVGGNEVISFDTRVISATNRDLLQWVQQGRFREDLYYRLFQFPIQLPSLRERGQDLLLLTQHFMKEYKEKHADLGKKHLSQEARKVILSYPWPGNVRELKSTIERAMLIADGDEILVDDLLLNEHVILTHQAPPIQNIPAPTPARTYETQPPPVNPVVESASVVATPMVAAPPPMVTTPSDLSAAVAEASSSSDEIVSLEEIKRKAVERAYYLCDKNVDKAAMELDIGRATMYRLLKKYEIID